MCMKFVYMYTISMVINALWYESAVYVAHMLNSLVILNNVPESNAEGGDADLRHGQLCSDFPLNFVGSNMSVTLKEVSALGAGITIGIGGDGLKSSDSSIL